ncbi:hypothetical protein [Microvirga arsenatis]|uniref:Uncharacterized protein n=1 Tax=Microvirga arsenatis TaxID=2692265 RepID=A0ABW9YUU3_9HYPH|nr:hypothetical protein [Microvirga arsenatis]NBJ09339.1 hypothetical protein [Microvirga arsenatis]NBJ23803.1 hypothetical protein [Microvirga arsenatis]
MIDPTAEALARLAQSVGKALLEFSQQISSPRRDETGRAAISDDLATEIIKDLKRKYRNASWVMLRKGCEELDGQPARHTTKDVGASSRSFARRAMEATGLGPAAILAIMDRNGW